MIILIPDKIDFKTKNITRDKESNFIMISRSDHQEDITVLNVYYMPNDTASKHLAKTDRTARRINKSIIIFRDYIPPLKHTGRNSPST